MCHPTNTLCMHVGVHCHLLQAPFRTPALVRPPFHLPATPPRLHTAMLTHPPPCMHAGAHHHPFAPLLWCTHPSVCVQLPRLGLCPTLLACPLRAFPLSSCAPGMCTKGEGTRARQGA